MHASEESPKERYKNLVKNAVIDFDPSQQYALDALQNLYQELRVGAANQPRFFRRSGSGILGLYLWGKVGRGKTLLVNLLVESLDHEKCLRLHFHHFMAMVHQQLKHHHGSPDPLKIIARHLAQQYQVLCFDEFFVSDIGDAMLLGRLMQYLFRYQVTLVATSNTPPEDLYRDGLQRSRFLPAIEAIKNNTRTIHLAGHQDHRNKHAGLDKIYFTTQNSTHAETLTEDLLKRYDLPVGDTTSDPIMIMGRKIPCVSQNGSTICFQFSHLCEGPRSHLDYMEIARQFEVVILLDVPLLGGVAYERIKARGTEDGHIGSGATGERAVALSRTDDAARRFIALIDELYDQRIRLVLTSQVPLCELYTHGNLMFEFERARSRLMEMGSSGYS